MSDISNNTKGDSDFHFFDYLIILLKWHRVLILVFLLAAVISVLVSLSITPKYTATATIMAPQTPNLISMLGGGQSALQRLAQGSIFGGSSRNLGGYNYFAILNSRSLREDVIEEFNLVEHYNLVGRDWERVHERLSDRMGFGIDRNEYITISIEDESPDRAAAMSRFIVNQLNIRSIELSQSEATANRLFLENRLDEVRLRLAEAEKILLEHFESTNILAIPEQNLSTLGFVTDLYVQKVEKEIELAFLKNSFSPDDRLVRQLQFELNEINSRVESIPQSTVESLRKYREVAIMQRLLEFLTPLLEQARIEEQRNVPVLLVLDEPRVPEKKSSPHRALIVLVTVFVSVAVTLVIILIRERLVRMVNKDAGYQKKSVELREAFTKVYKRRPG